MSELFIERRQIRRETAYCVTDGVRLLGACLSEAAAKELLEASLLASTAILHTPVQPLKRSTWGGFGEQ